MNTSLIISIVHILITSPLIVLFAITDILNLEIIESEQLYWPFVLVVLLTSIYHLYRYVSTSSKINMFHLIGIVPILIYYAYYGQAVVSPVKYLSIGIALTAIIFHIRRLFNFIL